MRRTRLLSLAPVILLSACGGEKPAPAPVAETPKAAVGAFGVDLTAMDKAVKPGDDFYQYANGTWLKTYEIPADRASYGTGALVFEKTEGDIRGIVDEVTASKGAPGTIAQKVGDLYAGWMDEAAIEARGIAPLKPYLDQLAAIQTKADLVKLAGNVEYAAPFTISIYPDSVDPTRYAVWVAQSGLGMPNRDYYLNKGEKFDAYRAAYKTYVTTLFQQVGDKDPAGSAAKVIGLETKIATVAWTPERQRNVKEYNNPMDRAGLKKLAPAADWDVVLSGLGLGDADVFLVNETTAIRDGSKLFDTQPIDTWKAYLTFQFINSNAANLTKTIDDARFAFFGKAINGTQQKRDRWKRGLTLIDNQIGEGLGELYVARHFPPATKAKMDDLIANLRTALKSKIDTSTWMDEPTKTEALKKLTAFDPRVGYPAKWIDYGPLTITPGKLFENILASRHFEWNRQVARLHKPVDRNDWLITPQTVDAYYDPSTNQITFPAGILQPPFFDPNADPAVNYGAIGAVIGHEIGHGFDDQGREYDGAGKIRNWWTEETSAKFVAKTTRLGAQYAAFCPLEGQCVNGSLTMGENIGDLGGLEMAYAAYKLSLDGKEAPVIDGFTGDQRFFLAFAQAWRAKMRDDAMRSQMLTDPHSPPAARGSFPERNMDAWYAAFDVKEGDKGYIAPEARVHIW